MSVWQFYYNLVSKLDDRQLSHLHTINWLLSCDNRGEGRSLLMALGFIRKAIKMQGLAIEYFDHAGSDTRKRDIIQNILNNMIMTNRHARHHFKLNSKIIKLEHKLDDEFLDVGIHRSICTSNGLLHDITEVVKLAKKKGASDEEIQEAVDLALIESIMSS